MSVPNYFNLQKFDSNATLTESWNGIMIAIRFVYSEFLGCWGLERLKGKKWELMGNLVFSDDDV